MILTYSNLFIKSSIKFYAPIKSIPEEEERQLGQETEDGVEPIFTVQISDRYIDDNNLYLNVDALKQRLSSVLVITQVIFVR